eukprot:TRINITY_DN10428_c0_g2_i1.p1 TRINITY_DN10428_c0_g2~~TRINITY_DN10428_c0_g2_i1.p1  ORF type:complete len:433 (+),score=96.79 TRINITY_DN10428_c0_g2_i1:54-1352(+)
MSENLNSPAATATTPVPTPGTPARSRQGSTASALPPKTPITSPDSVKARSRQGSTASQGPGLSKQGSRASLKESVTESAAAAAAAAAGTPIPEVSSPAEEMTRQGSHLSGRSQGTARASAASLAPSEPREPVPEMAESVHSDRAATPVAPPTTPPEARSVETELADARAKVHSLEQQNASLQRLMSSGSGEVKIKMLTQDLAKRSERIKSLEAEVKRLTKRAEEAETKARANVQRRASRSSMNVSEKGSSQDRAVIKELQAKLHDAEGKIQALQTKDGRPTSFPAGGQNEAQGTIFKLQTMLAERDAEVQMLQQKLQRAQDAIVSSAGAGFENEVKLQQARTALQSILRSQSPQHSSSRAPSQPTRGASPMSPLSTTAALTQYPSTASKPKAYYETLVNPYSTTSLASPTSAYSPLGQPRSVSPTRRFVPQY